MDLKEQIINRLAAKRRLSPEAASIEANYLYTLFQTHLEEQLEGLRVMKVTPELTRQYSHLETYNVGDYNAPIECKELEWHIPELLHAQLKDVKKQLRDIWREK